MTLEKSRKQKRDRKYKLLREAGYSNSEATRFRDLSNWKVIKLIEAREDFNDKLDPEYKLLDIKIQSIIKGVE